MKLKQPTVFASCHKQQRLPAGHDWHGPFWGGLPEIPLLHFHPHSSSHHPRTRVKLACNEEALAVCFRVEDRYVICRHTQFMALVCQDSCVEFFFQPGGADGYFNIEANCGGTVHASYIRNPQRAPGGFVDWTPLKPEHGKQISVYTALPEVIFPEITSSLTWTLAMHIPFGILAPYCGEAALQSHDWKGNFHKCADSSSHPHWGSWLPVEPLNFHQPECFGNIQFIRG